MCRAGFADGIQIIAVLATFGLFLIENILKIPEMRVVWRCFLTNQMLRRVKTINIFVLIRSIYALVFLCTKSSSTYFRHTIKVYTSDRHDTVSQNHTVMMRKMRSAGLYSTARYGLYFWQYIDGYMITKEISYINIKIPMIHKYRIDTKTRSTLN